MVYQLERPDAVGISKEPLKVRLGLFYRALFFSNPVFTHNTTLMAFDDKVTNYSST